MGRASSAGPSGASSGVMVKTATPITSRIATPNSILLPCVLLPPACGRSVNVLFHFFFYRRADTLVRWGTSGQCGRLHRRPEPPADKRNGQKEPDKQSTLGRIQAVRLNPWGG